MTASGRNACFFESPVSVSLNRRAADFRATGRCLCDSINRAVTLTVVTHGSSSEIIEAQVSISAPPLSRLLVLRKEAGPMLVQGHRVVYSTRGGELIVLGDDLFTSEHLLVVMVKQHQNALSCNVDY